MGLRAVAVVRLMGFYTDRSNVTFGHGREEGKLWLRLGSQEGDGREAIHWKLEDQARDA